jgi:hypothetical protein
MKATKFIFIAIGLTLITSGTSLLKAKADDEYPEPVDIIEPLRGFNPKTQAFKDLPPLKKYIEPSTELQISRPDSRSVIYDVVVRPFPIIQGLEAAEQLMVLVGSLVDKPGPPNTSGPLDSKSLSQNYLEVFEGGLRVRVLNDGVYGIYKFSPAKDSQGSFRYSDPYHPGNWKLLSKDEAINRLHASMSYQTQVNRDADPTFKDMFSQITGISWGPQFILLNPPRGPHLSEILHWSRNEQVLINTSGGQTKTTIGAFLFGQTPSVQREAELKTRTAIFQNIGASSVDRDGRLANVWHQDFKQGMQIGKTVQETLDWAKKTGARDVSVVYNQDGRSLAQELKRQFEYQGLKVRLVHDDKLSNTTMVSSGMGDAIANPQKSSIVFRVNGQRRWDYSNQTGDSPSGVERRLPVPSSFPRDKIETKPPPTPLPPPVPPVQTFNPPRKYSSPPVFTPPQKYSPPPVFTPPPVYTPPPVFNPPPISFPRR